MPYLVDADAKESGAGVDARGGLRAAAEFRGKKIKARNILRVDRSSANRLESVGKDDRRGRQSEAGGRRP
jgi:hypothetical protein